MDNVTMAERSEAGPALAAAVVAGTFEESSPCKVKIARHEWVEDEDGKAVPTRH